MAAEYEVNISLNTKKINGQLETLEKRLSNISKAADPLGSGPGGAQRSRNLDRIRATGVIINRLGRELNKLEAQGVKVQNERSRIKRAVQKLDKGLVETARAHVVEIRAFVREANKGLKTKEKTVKLDSVQNKFSERRLRALARSNERNEKDLRLNQRMTAEARARMRLLSQSGAQAFIRANPPAQGRQMADDIDARLKAQEKSARLANRINELEVKGVNVAKHRKQLGKIRTAQANSNFGLAEREIRVLRKSLELEQSKLRILKEQSKFLAGGPMRFPSGRQVTNPFDVGPARALAQAAPSSFIGEKQLQDIATFEKKQQRAALNAHMRQLGFIQKQTKARIAANDKLLQDDRKRLADFDRDLAESIADRQKMFQGVAKAGIKPDSVFGPLRQLGQASMVAGANEAKLLAGRFRAPSSPLTARPVTRASAAQAAQQVEELVRARAALEKRATDDAAAYKMRADKQVHNAQLALDQIEYKNKIDDIVELTNLQIKEGERAGKAFDRELKRRSSVSSSGLTGQTSPIRGTIFQQGSPNQKLFEGVALGAGFPALFGGGAGSIIGGGLGGLTGSFGAQIALSAIGQQIDTFVAGMVDAGKALTSVGGAADFMAEKSLFSSDAMQFRIEKLIEEGNVTEAAALMTQEMAKQVGGSGLKALKDLGTEASKMGKLFNTLILQIQAFIAQGLTPLLKAINTVVGNLTLNNQFNTLIEEATGDRAKEINEFLKPFTTKISGQGGKNIRTRISQEGKRLAIEKFGGQVIPEGAAIEPTGLEVLRAADSGADKAAKDKERVAGIARRAGERLQIMQQEGNLAKELKKLDFERAAEIEKINKLENVGLEERQNAIQATNDLYDALTGQAIGEALAKDLQTAIDLKKAQEDVLRPLEDQRRLLQGKLDGNEKEVRLQLEIENIMRLVKGLNKEDVEDAVRKNAALEEQVKQVERLEQLYQQVGSAIENALVDGIMAAIDGTKSLQSIVSSLLKDVGKMFLQFGIRTALNAVNPSVFPMAEGGFVSSPTRALVGEGGQGEYVIPENKMRESMARYSRGARGASVIPSAGDSGALGGSGGTAVADPIDVRYTVERINSVDYVTADQFQAGMRQAANQGAKQGEQQTLKRLQMSGSTRKRLGL